MSGEKIHVLIVEDSDLAKRLVDDHLNESQVTFAQIFERSDRDDLVKAIEAVEV